MKKPIAIILAAIMMFALCACGNTATDSSDSGPTYVFTFGTVDTDEHPSTMSAKKLGEILNEKAPGKWQINVHPNSTLGGAAELVESIQMGNVDMACPATSFLANYVPSIGVLDLPYMFTNTSEAYAVLDGDVGQQLAADVEAVGIKCLSYWEVGFRCIANSARPINSVEDVSGLRLRIMSNEIHQALFSALGVDPVPMGLADALVANQQGTIDGMDNPMSGLYTTSVYEFDKYIAVTNHVYTAQAVIMSNKAWSSMTPDDQAIFMDLPLGGLPIEGECRFLPHAEEVVEQAQTLVESDFPYAGIHVAEASGQVSADAGEESTGLLDAALGHGHGNACPLRQQ